MSAKTFFMMLALTKHPLTLSNIEIISHKGYGLGSGLILNIKYRGMLSVRVRVRFRVTVRSAVRLMGRSKVKTIFRVKFSYIQGYVQGKIQGYIQGYI